MKKIIALIFLFLPMVVIYSQTTQIILKIYEEDNLMNDSFKIKIIKNNKNFDIKIIDTIVFVPDSLFGQQVTLQVQSSKYVLNFSDLIIGWNKLNLQWKIFLDFPPFDNKWIVKGKKYKYKWIYAIDRGNGTTVTYYGKNKLSIYKQ